MGAEYHATLFRFDLKSQNLHTLLPLNSYALLCVSLSHKIPHRSLWFKGREYLLEGTTLRCSGSFLKPDQQS